MRAAVKAAEDGVRGKRTKWVTRVTLWDDRDDHVGGVG